MRIGIGSDHLGYSLKETIKAYLTEVGVEAVDFGCSDPEPVDYPDIAFAVAGEIQKGCLSRAILVCGTGNGMAIAANKVQGIRAALCHDPVTAMRARQNNDAHILTMGALIIDWTAAKQVIDIWLASDFQGGNSARKVQKIIAKEQEQSLNSGSDLKPSPGSH